MSHDSPEPTTNCRGIINPNYPGFQHLAHTLSEHFFEHQFEHSSEDSDLSEFESEPSRSVDVQDDQAEIPLPPPPPQYILDLNNTNNNNYNNNNTNNNNNCDSLDKIEDILRGAFSSQEFMLSPTTTTTTSDAMATTAVDAADEIINETFIGKDDDLETYLSRYEPTSVVSESAPLPAPDILMKHRSSLEGGITAGGDCSPSDRKPDILQNVSVDEAPQMAKTGDWDIGSVTMTPVVDIVGNFEQEIEHEIGLIVSGYKSSSSASSSLEELNELAKEQEVVVVEDAADTLAEKIEQSLEKVSETLFFIFV